MTKFVTFFLTSCGILSQAFFDEIINFLILLRFNTRTRLEIATADLLKARLMPKGAIMKRLNKLNFLK
jgi:hypothetical protein